MSIEYAPQRQRRAAPTRYLTKDLVRQRYCWKSKISVDRAWQVYGTLPPPTTYQGRHPLWAEHLLDAHDARSQESSFTPEMRAATQQHTKRMHEDGTLRKRKGRRAAKAKPKAR
jgi:hypothetical protein